jgi:hypothetical protein
MRQLEQSLGHLLHDPHQRFELELVLRASPKRREHEVAVPAQRR